MKLTTLHKFSFILFFILILSFDFASATDFYWTGAANTNYNNLSNWKTGSYSGSAATALPTASDNLFIGGASSSNYTVNLNINDTISSLTIEGTGQIFINSSTAKVLCVAGDLTNTNSNTVGGGTALIRFYGSADQTWSGDGSTDGIGKCPNMGIQKSGGTLSLSGFITMGGSTTLSIATTNSGSIDAGNSTVVFTYADNIRGDWVFNNVMFYGRGGSYTIYAPAGKIVVLGSIILSAAGVVTIDSAEIELLGDLDNQNGNSSSVIHSQLVLTGGNEQALLTNNTNLDRLKLNKTDNRLTLRAELTVNKNLDLTAGNIQSYDHGLILIDNATAVNASDASFVEGGVIKQGNDAFTFPLGAYGEYHPLGISAPSSSSDEFIAQYFDEPSGITDIVSPITYTDPCEYWNLEHTSGSASVNVTLAWDNPCFHIASLSYFVIARDSSSNWVKALGTFSNTGNTTTGTITSNTARSTWGDLTLAKTNPLVVANAGRDTGLCTSHSATIGGSPTASGGTGSKTYAWSPSTGLNNTTGANPVSTPTLNTTYVVEVTDNINEKGWDTVVVNGNPVADAGFDTTLCKNLVLKLGGSPPVTEGTGPFTYLWSNNIGDTMYRSGNPHAFADSSIELFLTVEDKMGCTSIDSMQITIPNPIEVSWILDTVLFLGEDLQFDPYVSGGVGPLSFAWSPNLWLDDTTIINPTCTPLSSTLYHLTVQDSIGCSSGIYKRIDFRVIDLLNLATYSAFAAESIVLGDTTVSEGDLGAPFIDTLHLNHIYGELQTDTTLIKSLKGELDYIISDIDAMSATTISGNLSNDTLTSGVYRISTSAFLDGVLYLAGNDSSYFIFDIDSDFVIADTGKIIHPDVDPHKVFFSVNGEINFGDSLELNCTFLCKKKMNVGGFVGHAALISGKEISVESFGNKIEPEFYTCWFDQNAIADGKVTPLYPVLPYNPPMHGNFPLTNYIEVFSDDFDETDFSDDVTLNYGDISKIWYDWGRQGNDTFPVWANIPIVNNYYTQNEINLTDNHNLILPLTKLSFPYWTDPDIHMLRKYSLSIITTTSKFYHGYFEIRAKLPNDYGDWPAFWLIDGSCLSNGDHDDYREIDFFDAYSEPENELPQGIIMNACADSYHAWISCVQHDGGGLGYYNFNLSDEYHIYGCSWTQDNISFYIDNVLIASNPNSLVNDQRMYLVLNNAIEPWLGENLDVYGTGESSPKRDFKVDYVKVYQKVDDMFNIYGVEDCNGKKLETLDFPVETGIPSSWRYRMDCGNDFRSLGYTYQWISSDPSNLHIYGSANLPSVYFYGTAIGTYTLTLHVSPPSSGIFNFYYERTIDINIVSVPDLTTHIHHNQIGNSCSFNFYYDAVPDATKIMVSEDGGITFYESSSTEIGDFPVAELGTDFDFVVRAYYYSCLFYEATSSITLYPPEGCYDRRENNELAVNSKSDSLLVFPSPSNGNLFILNKSNKNLKIFFYTLSKKEILQIRLRPNEIQKINNIPFGVLILEAINEENSFIFDRKLVPVIEVD